ncbi:MAG: type IV pilin protein [Pirellulaceae bacterium]
MRKSGFTLIELLITIAILAIIVAIAVPSYNKQVEKSRRADAITGLMQAAQLMERCYTRTNTYTGCNPPTTSPDGYYDISVDSTSSSATTFKLVAAPKGAQINDSCGSFKFDHRGIKESEGGDNDRCWGS